MGTDGSVQATVPVGDPNALREFVRGIGDEAVLYTDPEHQQLMVVDGNGLSYWQLDFSPLGITRGPGNVDFWITENDGVNHVSDEDGHTILHVDASPNSSIIVGPDNNLWFAEGGSLVRMNTDGEMTPSSITAQGGINDLCAGPDGTLWYTDNFLNQVGQVDTDGNLIHPFDAGINSAPYRIVVGPDRALWFTERGANRIGRITVNGDMSHYPIPSSPGGPYGITAGPDGNIWFTEYDSGKIGRLRLDQ